MGTAGTLRRRPPRARWLDGTVDSGGHGAYPTAASRGGILGDPRARPDQATQRDVLALQQAAGNQATVSRLAVQREPDVSKMKPAATPAEAEARCLAPPITWIDDLDGYLKTQIDTFSESYFDKQAPEKQQALVDKRTANRTTFMINMRRYLGGDAATITHFQDVKPLPGTDLWGHVSTRERLLEVKDDVEQQGSPMPATSVGQSLRGRHLHPESKAPGAGMMTHAMGFAVDWKAYAAPHVTDPRLHALFKTVTGGDVPAMKLGAGWDERHDLIEAMGKGESNEKTEALLANVEKEYERLVAGSNKFKADLPEDSMKPLRELEDARRAIGAAERRFKELRRKRGRKRATKEELQQAAAEITAAREAFDAKAQEVRSQLAAIFEPWTEKLDAAIADIEAQAAAKGVDLSMLTGRYGFKELRKKIGATQRARRPHERIARQVLSAIRRHERRLNAVAQRFDAAAQWLAHPGKRPIDPADAERWQGDVKELAGKVDEVRGLLAPVQSRLGTLLPGKTIAVERPKASPRWRVTDSRLASLRKQLDALPEGITASAGKLEAADKPLADLIAAQRALEEDLAARRSYMVETKERLGGKRRGDSAVRALLDQKLEIIALKGAKDALLSDAGGFVTQARSVRNPGITQLLGLMSGTEGGGFFTPDPEGGKDQAKKKQWSREHGFNLTFIKAMMRHGFEAGVAWEKSPDTMHFELVEGRRLLESGGSREVVAGKRLKMLELLGFGGD